LIVIQVEVLSIEAVTACHALSVNKIQVVFSQNYPSFFEKKE
jgi:hypothetical protein